MDPENQVAEENAEDIAAFDGGFDTEPSLTGQPVVTPADDAPKMAQIPEDEYRKLLDGVAKIDEIEGALEKQFGTAFGKIGGIERVLDQLKSSAPAGGKIELSEEVVADLAAEFPEMAALQYKTLQKLVDVLNTSRPPALDAGAAQPSVPVVDEAAIEKRVRRAIAEETLDAFDEKWRETIGLPDAKNVIPDTPFRQWLKKQPKEYADRVGSTYSAAVLTDALTKFKTAQTKAQGRRDVLDAAVDVPGSGGQAPAAINDDGDDSFNEGFKSA